MQPSGENVAVEQQSLALERAGVEVHRIYRYTDEAANRRTFPLTSALRIVGTWEADRIAIQVSECAPDAILIHNLFPGFGSSWLSRVASPVVSVLHNYRFACANGLLFRSGHPCELCINKGSWQAVQHKCYQGSRLASIPMAVTTAGGVRSSKQLEHSAFVVAQSERMYRFLHSQGLPLRKLLLIPGFVETTILSSPTSPRDVRFVFVGRPTPEKGLWELLRIWPKTFKLDIYGTKLATANEHPANIVFHGPIERHDLISRLHTYTGLIFPGLAREGAYPLVVREAMAAGLPILARSGTSAADLVEQSRAGFVYFNDSRLHLHQRIQSLLDHKDQLRVNALEFASRFLTEESWTTQMLALLRKTKNL